MVNSNVATRELLAGVSSRLSGRSRYRKSTYSITIENTAENMQRISMTPAIDVFPNTHRRTRSDKMNILEYVLLASLKLSHESIRYEDNEIVSVDVVKTFIPGHYVYLSGYVSTGRHRRGWVRINHQGENT